MLNATFLFHSFFYGALLSGLLTALVLVRSISTRRCG